MKKILFVVAAFAINATFAQTEKGKVEKKKTTESKKETKAVESAKTKKKKEIKEVGKNEMGLTEKVEAVPSIDVPSTNKEQGLEESLKPVHTPPAAPTAPAAPPVDVNKVFEFKNDNYDFGKIPAGKPVKYELYIKNVSKESAELTLVQPGCGCTTPEYEPKKKFAPGESVKVVLGFNNAAAAGGAFSKAVTVTLNGTLTKQVFFKGEAFAVPTESAPANNAIDKLKPEPAKP